MTKNNQETQSKYQKMTINIPKKIMLFLKHRSELRGRSIKEEVEYRLLDNIRFDMQGVEMEGGYTSLYAVGVVFYEELGDHEYKPKALVEATKNELVG